ncbi:MAG: PAS domain S-box protein, partial [bacterium]
MKKQILARVARAVSLMLFASAYFGEVEVREGEVVPNVEVRRQTKEGREIITSMTLSPLRNAEGRIIGVTRICKDVTQMKRAEERLLLTERLTSLGELTAGVA